VSNPKDGQRPFTAGCRIDVRQSGGTYIARAAGLDITASCTCGAKAAAERCAEKVFGPGNWDMMQRDSEAFIATRDLSKVPLQPAVPAAPKPAATKAASAWRDPAVEMPDDDMRVVLRRNSDEYPLEMAERAGGVWYQADLPGTTVDEDAAAVTGWMHPHEAAAILDAAKRGEVCNG